MCMLCVIPPNVIPSREKLENSALNNPDGFGFAIVIPSEKRIHAERTMNADTSISRFIEMREKYPEGYAMWHARLSTHGTVTVDNCHPFMVGGDSQTYLAHNGILPILEPIGDRRSDTRIFAEDLFPAIGGVAGLDNPQVLNLIEDFTSGSKLCILTVDPRAKYQCYIIHEEKGVRDESDVWWSNDSYELSYYRGWNNISPTKLGLSRDDEEAHFLECGICDWVTEATEQSDNNYCSQCGSCYMCAMYMSNCMCYQGTAKDYDYSRFGGWHSW